MAEKPVSPKIFSSFRPIFLSISVIKISISWDRGGDAGMMIDFCCDEQREPTNNPYPRTASFRIAKMKRRLGIVGVDTMLLVRSYVHCLQLDLQMV